MTVKIVLKQTNMGIGSYITLIRDCHDFVWRSGCLNLVGGTEETLMVIPQENLLYLEVLENEDSES